MSQFAIGDHRGGQGAGLGFEEPPRFGYLERADPQFGGGNVERGASCSRRCPSRDER